MRDQAHLVTGSFDEVVTRLSRVSTAQMSGESVQEIKEMESHEQRGTARDKCASYLLHACGNRGHIARMCDVNRNQGSAQLDQRRLQETVLALQ